MRREIETAPKDGKLVILEDDAAGTFELGRWSTKRERLGRRRWQAHRDYSGALASTAT